MPDLREPLCPICRDAGWIKSPGPMGQAIKCVCNRVVVEPPTPPVRQPRRAYEQRLNS